MRLIAVLRSRSRSETVCHGDQVAARAIVMQRKTQRPAQFEITAATRDALQAWIKQARLKPESFLFPSQLHESPSRDPTVHRHRSRISHRL